MKKKKFPSWITIKIGESIRKHFDNRKDLVEFLGIRNTSRKAIEARCRVLSFEVEFSD